MRQIENAAHRGINTAMTVEQMIQELQLLDPEAIVLFTCDYGDHCHTMQALPVETIEPLNDREYLSESAYSKSGVALNELKDDQDLAVERIINVVILRY